MSTKTPAPKLVFGQPIDKCVKCGWEFKSKTSIKLDAAGRPVCRALRACELRADFRPVKSGSSPNVA